VPGRLAAQIKGEGDICMTLDEARAFAADWIAAWNRLDMEAVLAHYADEVEFLSPLAERLTGAGRVVGRPALRAYWTQALATRPDLHFELEDVFAGAGCLTILYRNHRGERAAETVELDAQDKVVRSYACYRPI
jgi:ketosteroid isomerase-like protein